MNLRRGQSPFLVGQVLGDLGSGLWSVEGFELAILESKGFVADGPLKVALSEDGAHRVEARIWRTWRWSSTRAGRPRGERCASARSPLRDR